VTGELGKIDLWLERLYRRLGWRIAVVNQLFSWLSGLVLGTAGVLICVRIYRLSADEALTYAAYVFGLCLVDMSVGTFVVYRLARPLSTWLEGGRDPATVAVAWRKALSLPSDTVRWNVGIFVVTAPAAILLGLSAVVPVSLDDALAILFLLLLALIAAIGGGLFTGQLAMRPVVRDIADSVDRPLSLAGGISVRRKLLLAVPSLLAVTAGGAIAASLAPGSQAGDALGEMVFGVALALGLAGPIAVWLAYSTLEPLDDLMRATERLKQGDLTARVPALSADEHGALARSFNEAMERLQRFAEENERLLEEARASRGRIVSAGDAERRRVERNLHDGAQQRLVAVALQLQLLEESADSNPGLREMAGNASDELRTALDDLRELARGLHPQVLSTGGLGPALEQLAERAPVPVKVSAPPDRYPDPIESTAYFVASEALANVAKYAQAKRAEVSAERRNGNLVLAITDDGVGGADAASGSGLTGLDDRVAALDGRLRVESPAGEGTTVTVELPLDGIEGVADGHA